MRENNHAILREMDIRLQSMGTSLDGSFERRYGVLGISSMVSAMRDCLRKASPLRVFPLGRERSWTCLLVILSQFGLYTGDSFHGTLALFSVCLCFDTSSCLRASVTYHCRKKDGETARGCSAREEYLLDTA